MCWHSWFLNSVVNCFIEVILVGGGVGWRKDFLEEEIYFSIHEHKGLQMEDLSGNCFQEASLSFCLS